MKIILSRKGFDSAAGGIPSPILEDGTMLPLPIPSKYCPIRYSDIELHGHDLGRVIEDLGAKRKSKGRSVPLTADRGAHLDPDLVAGARKRSRGWRPLFGQADGEQTLLERSGVGPGDLFLFFGWFRRAEVVGGRYRFVRGAENVHVLWGWLQVDRVWDLTRTRDVPTWAADHPHFDSTPRSRNALYLGARQLQIGGERLGMPGAGVFRQWIDRLRLTAPGRSRSVWRLPGWFDPRGRRPLGYHSDPDRWTSDGKHVLLQTVSRGQEFVLDAEEYPQAWAWARHLLDGG
jgi:hypothetical protein